jgi:hypothetical protein
MKSKQLVKISFDMRCIKLLGMSEWSSDKYCTVVSRMHISSHEMDSTFVWYLYYSLLKMLL